MENYLYFIWVAKKILRNIAPKKKIHLALLFILMFLSSFAEVVSIGAVIPFLAALTAPEKLLGIELASETFSYLELNKTSEIVFFITILFCTTAMIVALLRVTLLWATMRLTYSIGAEIGLAIFRRKLQQTYLEYKSFSSGEIINGILVKVNGTTSVIMSFLSMLSACLTILFILISLFAYNPIVPIILGSTIGTVYLILSFIFKKFLKKDSRVISVNSTRLITLLQEAFGSFKDIKISKSQKLYEDNFSKIDSNLKRAQGNVNIIGGIPRFILESLGIIALAISGWFLVGASVDKLDFIPILGAFALGAQRMLPAMQQAYAGWANIKGTEASLIDVIELLEPVGQTDFSMNELPGISFERQISFHSVSFSYDSSSSNVLSKISLEIPKGCRLGIIGPSGSGKSTFADIIMALLVPSEGYLKVDEVQICSSNTTSWQALITHVSQDIFILEKSVAQNIAFGVPDHEIDMDRVRKAAKQAQLSSFIEGLPNKYESNMGERGAKLSGGQKQRLGIARAYYKDAKLIVFDEVTNALDSQTENEVLSAIYAMPEEITVIIITHKPETLKNCSKVIKFQDSSLVFNGTWGEFTKGHID